MVIWPTEHAFSTSKLASHSSTLTPNNIYAFIRGEVFDFTTAAATYQRAVGAVLSKAMLKYELRAIFFQFR